MILGIVGFPGPLLDHDPFGITPTAGDLRIHIILPIATRWKAALSVLEVTPTDVAWKWASTSLFELCEKVVDFLRWCGNP